MEEPLFSVGDIVVVCGFKKCHKIAVGIEWGYAASAFNIPDQTMLSYVLKPHDIVDRRYYRRFGQYLYKLNNKSEHKWFPQAALTQYQGDIYNECY